MHLDKTWIARHIPHQGGMCLLEEVLEFDDKHIVCRTLSHCDPANPMRAHGRLGAACGVEYAAQAAAIHGALLAAADHGNLTMTPRMGFLASIRAVEKLVDRLDDIEAALDVEAECLAGDGNQFLYGFSIRTEGRLLLAGRTAVVLNAQQLSGSKP